ncbi:hypothetical protein [Streptomyces buecherae]|uniref:Uncharacterized protein n=1 Tax=Streptomyces buecherae TaxID=2763006 RepID=A0A7H8NHT4_9ACTN|nr:hypothetical protein [Streptomyces buecherae]QKW48246.1 hypothetical protein HUT08_00340 [Streptomyces buecherae]QKW54084.1 hypothetical protein HUT08_36085 [Streptomyces buecherae]
MEYADLEGDEDDGEARVTVRVPVGTRLALTSVLERHRVWTQQLRARHQARLKTIAPAQRALLRGEQDQELHTLRSQGELLDTRDVLVAFGLRQEVQARGWDHPWPDVDPDEIPLGGVSVGTGMRRYPETLSLRLPATLVEQVRAGCWSASKESIRQLQQWRDDHPAAVLRPEVIAPEEQAAAEYRRLAASVTTTGGIYRAGIRRGLHAALQMAPPPLVTALDPAPR